MCYCYGLLFTAHLGLTVALFLFEIDLHNGLRNPKNGTEGAASTRSDGSTHCQSEDECI